MEGSDAGPDRGYVYFNGRPLCDDDDDNKSSWGSVDGNVVCKMLGFSRATRTYKDSCDFGDCPPEGIEFAYSGFKCTGRERDILDCDRDATVSRYCGNNGVTNGNADIVGVRCE